MDSDWQQQRIQPRQWSKRHLMRLASSFSCCCHYHYQSDSCSGRARLRGKSQSMPWWKNQKDVVKDLLSDDRNKEAEDDAKVMSSSVSERVVVLYLETGKAERKEMWGGKWNQCEQRSVVRSSVSVHFPRGQPLSVWSQIAATALAVTGAAGIRTEAGQEPGKKKAMGEGWTVKGFPESHTSVLKSYWPELCY